MVYAYNNHLILTFVVFLVFYHSYGLKEDEESVKLDFAIVGFPKCSTTFLRNDLLSSNEEIFFGNDDNEIHHLNRNNAPALKKLFQNHPYTINGFKCPNLLYSETGLFNLEMYFKQTDLIIAVRHPILWFQSFYNYRLRKGYQMPEPHLLIGSCPTIFEDRLNDTFTNLSSGDSYTINNTVTSLNGDEDRFYVHVSSEIVTLSNSYTSFKGNIIINKINNTVKISGIDQTKVDVEILDLNGKKIFQTTITNNRFELNNFITNGIYILKLQIDNKIQSKKILIN